MKELVKVQEELKAPKSQRNNFGKYNFRSCEDVLEAVKPLLIKNNLTLTISDEIKEAGNIAYVEATATISNSEKSITVKAQAGINPDRKGMDIAQSFGSSSSYARKYALNGLFLIDDTKDADATNDHSEKLPTATADVLNKALKAKATLSQVKAKYTLTREQEGKYTQQLNK
tara:strand:- start:32 stop:547 length:516 start_codon:yes stop_codon:yes gene_type:complete